MMKIKWKRNQYFSVYEWKQINQGFLRKDIITEHVRDLIKEDI